MASQDFSYVRPAFKAYDIRGRVPSQLNEDAARRIGMAFAKVIGPRRVAVGYDIRLSSPALAAAFTSGLTDFGVDVTDIGMCGTEEVYFSCGRLGFDGGVMITASHNPKEYNGIKMVLAEARPLVPDNGLNDVRELVCGDWDAEAEAAAVKVKGNVEKHSVHEEFIDYVLSLVDLDLVAKAKLRVAANCGNGGAGIVMKLLRDKLPAEIILVNETPDGNFPNGIPNPLLPENRQSTSDAVLANKAGLGAAWDGDFDRCFFFDENGSFIEGYYLVGLFAGRFLERFPGASIIHDPRLFWNTEDIVKAAGGRAVKSKTGHAFIKQAMRENGAVYGGEMSAHQYFKDFFFCDGGILPLLTLMEFIGSTGKSLSELIGSMMERYPVSGEINYRISRPKEDVFAAIKEVLAEKYGIPLGEDYLDGLSLEYRNFRINLRASNTEPLLRLNIETRADKKLLDDVLELCAGTIAKFA